MDYPSIQPKSLPIRPYCVRPRACAYARAAVSAISVSDLKLWIARNTPPITNRGVQDLSGVLLFNFYFNFYLIRFCFRGLLA
jgi:hypothetical protein